MFNKPLDPLKWPSFPGAVDDFFLCINSSNFAPMVSSLLNNEEFATTEGICLVDFEENFDPVEWDLNPNNNLYYPFTGVRFSFRVFPKDPLEAVFVTKEQFWEYLFAFCRYFVAQHPDLRNWTDKAMEAHGYSDKWAEWMK